MGVTGTRTGKQIVIVLAPGSHLFLELVAFVSPWVLFARSAPSKSSAGRRTRFLLSFQ